MIARTHKVMAFCIALFGAISGWAGSSAAATPHKSSMTCQEFLSLDDVTRPKVVYWAEGLNHRGKPEDAVVDVAETDRLVPVIVEQCRAAPKASFWKKLKTSWDHLEASVKKDL